jgi:2-keto-4-pentenoate hydratase/2-oxohepta-3-ene-1,7-dioic acid hydratase in catechol pathway
MYRDGDGSHLGALQGEHVLDLHALSVMTGGVVLPNDMLSFIDMGERGLQRARELLDLTGSTGTDTPEKQYARLLRSVEVLPPLDPPRGNVIAIGRNYYEHAEESARARGEEVTRPTVFTKAQTAINGPYSDVPIDERITSQVDWEVELGVVVGRRGINIPREGALDYVFGYTVLNDISARDLQFGWGGQYFKGKSLDGFCPIGPWIVTVDEVPDPQDLQLCLRVNGELKQNGNTRDMIFPIDELIAQLSLGMTLLPGTLIATGTPAGVGFARTPPEFLQPGDIMETEIEGIGLMRNRIVRVSAVS